MIAIESPAMSAERLALEGLIRCHSGIALRRCSAQTDTPAMKAVLAFAVAFLLGTGLLAQTKAPLTDAQRVEALKLSQMCAESGAKLLAKLDKDRDSATTYAQPQTHYNRALGRCLMFQTGFRVQSAGVSFHMKTVYDAVEGHELADYMDVTAKGDTTVSWCYTTNLKGERIGCVSDNHLVNIAEAAFDTYRLDVMNH
jgi:hypothetical protein